MKRFIRVAIVIGAAAFALLVARHSSADVLVTFQAPHVVRASAATLEDELARSIDERTDAAAPGSVEDLVRIALAITGRDLHFGLGHTTTLRFGTAEREANCIEYANLFAAVFNRGARRRQVGGRAYVVHSDARVLGKKLAMRGMGDHDWVVIVPSASGAPRLFVDPTFYDLGLAWDIAGSVEGTVRTP